MLTYGKGRRKRAIISRSSHLETGGIQENRRKMMEERMSLIVFSGTVDKRMAASILITGAAAMGMEVEVFLTTWGLEAFRKENYKTNMRVSKDFEDDAPV